MTFKEISGKELEENLDKYNIIDVREEDEYEDWHLPNAKNIPLSKIMEEDFRLDKDKAYILHCKTNGRSKRAYDILKSLGYKDLTIAPGPGLYDYKNPES